MSAIDEQRGAIVRAANRAINDCKNSKDEGEKIYLIAERDLLLDAAETLSMMQRFVDFLATGLVKKEHHD